MKLNFKAFRAYTGINHSESHVADVREQFADMIYRNVNGIRALTLATKIYKSTGAEDFLPEEVELIKAVANRLCLPPFIEGLVEQINSNSK